MVAEFVYMREFHTYGEMIFLMLICIAVIFLLKYLKFDQFLMKILKEHKKLLGVIVSIEWGLLVTLTNFGSEGLNEKYLASSLIIVISIMFILFVLLVKCFKASIDCEKKILIVRNEAVEQQYRELNEAYERYRCLLHDEKHMLSYLRECLSNGNTKEAIGIINNYQNNTLSRGK